MRKKFANELYELMKEDKNIFLITADIGFGVLDKIKDELPKQFFNVGAAEQVMMDMAIGFALAGKIPIVYSITPFVLFRPFEAIRNYINYEQVPVIIVGCGRGSDYKTEGYSHNASDDKIIWESFKNILTLHPEEDLNLREIVYMKKPVYLNLKR